MTKQAVWKMWIVKFEDFVFGLEKDEKSVSGVNYPINHLAWFVDFGFSTDYLSCLKK